jgi:hypothetical protein
MSALEGINRLVVHSPLSEVEPVGHFSAIFWESPSGREHRNVLFDEDDLQTFGNWNSCLLPVFFPAQS